MVLVWDQIHQQHQAEVVSAGSEPEPSSVMLGVGRTSAASPFCCNTRAGPWHPAELSHFPAPCGCLQPQRLRLRLSRR